MFHFTLPQQQQQFDQFAILNDPYIPSSSDNSVLTHKLNAGFTYLIYLKESNRILNDRRAFNTFAFLNSLNIDFYYNHFIDSYFDKISIICANLCYNYLDFLKKYVKNGCISNQNASTSSASDLDGFQFQLMNLVYEFILKITDRSKLFSNEFLLHKGVNSLINYFNDENLIKKLIDFKHMNYNGKSLLNNLLAIILNISVIADNAKVELNVMNAYGIIEKLIKQFKQNDNQRILAFMILINTGNDKQIEILLKSHKASIIQELEKIIKLASSEISGNNLNLKRFKTHVEIECEDGVTSGNNIEIIDDICFVCYNGYAWNLSKIFVTLICLASIDDFIKYDIYETYNLKDDLERIIFYGNHVEKLYATKLLWHCCLDGNVAKKFVKTPNLFDSIINTAKQVNFKNGLLKKYCDGIIWSIQPKVKNEEIAGGNCENESKNGHIMISYNSKSRSLCTKIKEKLESENHIVWIDYEKIHGSSLDSMALAIEESKCVLMCMNENYKESPNCRAVSLFIVSSFCCSFVFEFLNF